MSHPKVIVDGREYVPKLAPAINKDQTLAQYLVMLREDNDLTTADVEEITGLKHFYVESWEKNAGQMPFSHAALLARVYGVSLDLFGLRVTRAVEDTAEGQPLATHLDFDGTARRTQVDPLRKLPSAPVDYGGIVAITPVDEPEIEDEEDAQVEFNLTIDDEGDDQMELDLDVDDSDEFVDDEDEDAADEYVDEEPPAAFIGADPGIEVGATKHGRDTNARPASRLHSVMDELL